VTDTFMARSLRLLAYRTDGRVPPDLVANLVDRGWLVEQARADTRAELLRLLGGSPSFTADLILSRSADALDIAPSLNGRIAVWLVLDEPIADERFRALHPIACGPGASAAVTATDIERTLRFTETEARLVRAERELTARARQLDAIAELSEQGFASRDLEALFDQGARAAAGGLGVSFAVLLEPLPSGDLLLVRAGTGWDAGVVGACLEHARRAPAVARVLQHGTPVIDDAPAWLTSNGGLTFLAQHGATSGAAVAVPGAGGAQAILAAFSDGPRVFKSEDLHFLQALANIFASVIDRRTAEQDLLQSQMKLQAVQKMEAIGRLAGGIAHDFNNLVQAIGGYTEILLQRLPDADPLHHNAEEIKRAGDRAAALTRQLLAFSRQQVLQPKVIQLNVVVTNIEQLLRRLIGEDVELETALAGDLAPIKADHAQLEQVLMNLAVNSRDAMPDGGTLTIETRNVTLTEADQREAFAIKAGPYVLLAVSDTGCGMDAETRLHVFEPFFTTKPAGKGTGLGLSTVYGIVKQSEGYIWVDSEVGLGTRVRIYLPRVDEPVDTIEARRPEPSATPRGRETLLLVEDEESVRELICEWLAGHGYKVLVAGNGAEALQVAEAYDEPIDALIADVIMPQMGGPALAERILPQRPHMKVIFVSGYADEAIGDPRVLSAGAAFLQKPFSLDILVRRLREVLDA
jgi:two-component system cell cycle sensor histidine kinase/response regulator CckA